MTSDEQVRTDVQAIRSMYEDANPELVDLRIQHGEGVAYLRAAYQALESWSQEHGDDEPWPDHIHSIWIRHGIVPSGSDEHRQALATALNHESMQTNLLDQLKEGSA